MSERKPVGDGGGEDLAVPMWVWTVLAFTLLMAVLIVVIIRGGAKRETPPGDMAAPVTQPG